MGENVVLYHPDLDREVEVPIRRASALLRNGWQHPTQSEAPASAPPPGQIGGVAPQIPSWLSMPDPDLDPEDPDPNPLISEEE